MPRRGQARIRKTKKDPLYGDLMVAKLINRAMRDGKKSVAQKQVYGAFDIVKEKSSGDPLAQFHQALANIRPSMEVRPRRVGGAAYQVPMPVRGARQDALAIRWMVEAARTRSNSEFHTFADKLAAEILEAVKEEGGAVKKKTDMERVAEANRAFSHFRW
ncbi:30S ribosomal protein S7 [Candidatus Woesebacteria bacterium RIFCSPHIGHO2_01_FULL_44_21]|uniref:Small ribosomal subunit protein uS7 n=1 Tax=Candidatus Woesebacteria bacterium RIFCSPHIGHO2_01_FULL_44_21 TaxID=1802503 RepID=A0A1F7Z1M5_9BACT|nr:MAG: 30S ribosomal protein S7 [Candidatus Woesebacteria bacterium RIFCSPHIGHO2_01_FULL_44_21]OGM71498.1 MAG: 30S ribosomal protein S7 [Candidatus Woesebacteria bacterium RIFCSPLOWO2_01_FULL_44_24b]